MNKVIVLGDNLGPRTREIESVGLFCSTEVVQLKDQMLGKVRLVSPDDPSYT